MLKRINYVVISTFVIAIIIIIVGAAFIVFVLVIVTTIRRLVWTETFGVKRGITHSERLIRVQFPTTTYRPIVCLPVM